MIGKINKRLRNKKGFTLIELIVVIAILGILASMAIPKFGGITEKAKIAADEQLAEVLSNAAIMYYTEHNGVPTNTKTLFDDGLVKYADDAAVLAELKSDKYKAGTSKTVKYTVADQIVTVTISGTTDLTSSK